jgi:hypothetical protein
MCSDLHLQQVCDFVKSKKHAKIGDLGHFESHFGLGKNQEYAKIADYGHSEPLLATFCPGCMCEMCSDLHLQQVCDFVKSLDPSPRSPEGAYHHLDHPKGRQLSA